VELEAKLAAAMKSRNTALCRVFTEAVRKQTEADAAMARFDFDAVDRLDAEVKPTIQPSTVFTEVYLFYKLQRYGAYVRLSSLKKIRSRCCLRLRRSKLKSRQTTSLRYDLQLCQLLEFLSYISSFVLLSLNSISFLAK
jgi:hypothetical protein